MYTSKGGNAIDASPVEFLRVVPIEEVRNSGIYSDMADLAEIFNHEIVDFGGNDWRWKENRLASWFMDHQPVFSPSRASQYADGLSWSVGAAHSRASVDLNTLWQDWFDGIFSAEEMMKFYMQKGSSLCSFADSFGQREAYEVGCPGAKKPASRTRYTETVIEYMRRVHKGKVLKL